LKLLSWLDHIRYCIANHLLLNKSVAPFMISWGSVHYPVHGLGIAAADPFPCPYLQFWQLFPMYLLSWTIFTFSLPAAQLEGVGNPCFGPERDVWLTLFTHVC
jgi:hypothetical protein